MTTPTVSAEIKAIKLIAYHYIQQHQCKFLNRLTYILLEGLVELYANNSLTHALLTSASASHYVPEAIEMLMQQKVEAPMAFSRALTGNNQKQMHRSEIQNYLTKIQELREENQCLRKKEGELLEKIRMQSKAIEKMTYKYNSVTDLMFELKEKHEKQVQALEARYVEELDELTKKNEHLNQEIIRVKVSLELLERDKCSRPSKQREMEQQSQVRMVKALSLTNHVRHFTICRVGTLHYEPTTQPKQLTVAVNTDHALPHTHHQPTLTPVTLFNITVSSHSKATLTQSSQTISTSMHTLSIQTELSSQDITNLQQQHAELQQQRSLLTELCNHSQKQTQSLRTKLTIRDEEYIQLAKHYNTLHHQFQCHKQETESYKEQTSDSIAYLTNQIQRLSFDSHKQKRVPQLALNPQSLRDDYSQLGCHSDQTDESTPRKREESLPLSTVSQFAQVGVGEMEGYIRKETIGKYILQLLDRNCRGEEAAIIIDQIGSCLHWKQTDLDRIQCFRRRRLKAGKVEEQGGEQGQQLQSQEMEGLDAKLYRFLTGSE